MNAKAHMSPPRGVSQDEDTKIGGTPAIFVNKLYFTSLPLGVKITFAETFRVGNEDTVQPRVAVFLQHQDVVALHQLLGAAVKNIKVTRAAAEEPQGNA